MVKKLLVCVCALVLLMSGCVIKGTQSKLYDNDVKIAEEGDSYSFGDRIGDTDEKGMDITYSKFSGTQTIWTLEAEDSQIVTFEFDSTVDSGSFKAVLITPDKKIVPIFRQSAKDKMLWTLTQGKYRVKIVGKYANGEIKLALSYKDGVQATVIKN